MVRFSRNLHGRLVTQSRRSSSNSGKFCVYLAESCPFVCQIWALCTKCKNFFVFCSIPFKFGRVLQEAILFNIYYGFFCRVSTFRGIQWSHTPFIAKYGIMLKILLSARYLLKEWSDFHETCMVDLLPKAAAQVRILANSARIKSSDFRLRF